MNNTALGPNRFTTSARALTTGQYLTAAQIQNNAGKRSTQNSLTVSQMLSQPFFGTGGTLQSLWTQYGTYALIAGAVWAGVKWVLPMFGVRILWGKGGRRTGRRRSYSHLARARRISLARRRRRSSNVAA